MFDECIGVRPSSPLCPEPKILKLWSFLENSVSYCEGSCGDCWKCIFKNLWTIEGFEIVGRSVKSKIEENISLKIVNKHRELIMNNPVASCPIISWSCPTNIVLCKRLTLFFVNEKRTILWGVPLECTLAQNSKGLKWWGCCTLWAKSHHIEVGAYYWQTCHRTLLLKCSVVNTVD